MATITGLTAERMLDIEGKSVIAGNVQGDNLMLTKHNGTTMNAGNVRGPVGPQGAQGAASTVPGPPGPEGQRGLTGATGAQGPAGVSSIPGEIRMWSSSALPAAAYGRWTWADGSVFLRAQYPNALIVPEWQTFGGASDPAPLHFRVPDLRGLTPVGMDAMPGGPRANRMVRQVAIVLAGRAGEEVHQVTIAEMPIHNHGGGAHSHTIWSSPHESYEAQYSAILQGKTSYPWQDRPSGVVAIADTGNAQIINNDGGGVAHENVQPTVFIPYIVYLG